MATRTDPTRSNAAESLELTSIRDSIPEPRARRQRAPRHTALVGIVTLVGVALAAVATARASADVIGPGRVLSLVGVVAWAAAAFYVATRRPGEPLALLMAVGAVAGGLAMLGAAEFARAGASVSTRDLAVVARALGLALLPAIGGHLILGLPDGRLRTMPRRVTAAIGYVAALGITAGLVDARPDLPLVSITLFAGIAVLTSAVGFVVRGQRAGPVERPRFQWPAWGVTVALAIATGAGVLSLLVGWPDAVLEIAVGASVLVPIAIAMGASDRLAVRIDRLLVHTIVLAGLAGLVGASYLVIVLGLGRSPTDDEQTLLGLSMLAAAVAALLWVPGRERLDDFATRRVYGERHAPDEILRTFGSRLTRALPLDELLLQLAESLKKTMNLEVAEVWTRTAGRLDRAVSVPDRGAATVTLGAEEETVIARAGVSGPAWARVWLPSILEDQDDPVLRVAPVTNSGELLGMLVVRRPEGEMAFGEEDDQALTELARQVGLALHNVKLDSALQESLDEVRRQADELRASRVRIVEAGDAQRRAIERDLHDGAQQHLVALAVSVRLARQIAESDPAQANVMLEQISADLQEAVQELRNLAHGIYPPLLMDRGLPAALEAAAGRAALPTSVHAEGISRYPQGVEAAVYFCVLEALQNSGKHAGDGAQGSIKLSEEEHALLFEVADDGAGFDASVAELGHGFVNMRDRVGAFGGSIAVDAAPGRGTRIIGRVPLTQLDEPADGQAGE